MTAEVALTGMVLDDDALTPDEAAAYVVQPWNAAVGGIIETGRRLNNAKARVPHGSWGRVVEKLPFSDRTAQRLMEVADHPALANPTHVSDLPASWGTLAVLARIPADEVPDLIERKVIHPEITREQAKEIADEYEAARQAALTAWSDCVDQLTGALAYAKTGHRPPADLPKTYVTPTTLLDRAREVVTYLEGITK